MVQMYDILKLDSINRAGVRRIEIIFEEDIVQLPVKSPSSFSAEGSMLIKPDTRPYFLYFTHKSGLFEESGNTSAKAGDYSTQSIKLKSPQDRPILRDFVTRLENNEFAIVYLDWNGYWKILRRMRAKVDVTGNTFGSYNGATFQFSSKSNVRSNFWTWTDYPYQYIDPDTNELTPVDQVGPGDTGSTGSGTGNGGTGSGGSGSSDTCVLAYTHTQEVAATKWTIVHDLGDDVLRPRLKNAALQDLEAEGLVTRIWYKDANTMEIDFSSAQSGSALITSFGDCTGSGSLGDCCCDGDLVAFTNFYEITIPAEKKLTSIEVWSTLDKTVSVGTINGGTDIVNAEDLTAFVPLSMELGLFYLTQKKIYVSGSGSFKMKYYISGCADSPDSCCEGVKETATDSLAIIIPAEKKLTSIELWADDDVNVKVGDSVGTDEYTFGEVPYELAESVLTLNLGIFTLTEKIIYVSAPGDFTLKYYIK